MKIIERILFLNKLSQLNSFGLSTNTFRNYWCSENYGPVMVAVSDLFCKKWYWCIPN